MRTAPWLAGHGARYDFLPRAQRPDGWRGHPTAATSCPPSGDRLPAGRPEAASETVPDTIAAELVIPWLVDELNERLARSGGRLGATALELPQGVERQ